ncbi:glycosyltransferase family 4 protein [Micromonospora sp. HUAS YX12]|uniref:Glycosyltransferase family 4 protein n=1 Tax=Micromonospora sp. HUAS YX12 TaxID=3156396 RepID=A0AAU7R5R8_9ACTN
MSSIGTRRALVFSREYPPVTVGGTSTVARSLAVGLVAEGWDVAVLSSQPGGEDVRDRIQGVDVLRVGTGTVYNADTGLADDSLRAHRRLFTAAEQLCAEFGMPDLVALPDLFCFPEAALFSRRHRRPLLNILLQDFRAITPYDRDAHRVTNGVTASRTHLLELEEKSLAESAYTVFISHALSDAITGYYPHLETRHEVVHLGIDTVEIAAVADDPQWPQARAELLAGVPGAPLLVACGRLVPVKGFAQLLAALAHPVLAPVAGSESPPPRLVLIGVGPEEAHLRRLAATLGVSDRVSFLGDVPRREALGWMSVADVAVVPSLWESFCYVCAEMMAFGRPVVATAVDSLYELIPDDRYGYPVPVQGPSGDRRLDPAVLAAVLRDALADPEGRRRRGEQARNRVMERFTNDRFARGIATLGARLTAGAHA